MGRSNRIPYRRCRELLAFPEQLPDLAPEARQAFVGWLLSEGSVQEGDLVRVMRIHRHLGDNGEMHKILSHMKAEFGKEAMRFSMGIMPGDECDAMMEAVWPLMGGNPNAE